MKIEEKDSRKKPGQKPQGKVHIEWSADFAYAIGLIVSDGCLSKDQRHINLTSKDAEQIDNFQRCLHINLHVGRKSRGAGGEKKYYVLQIGDVVFYRFLELIGIYAAKSKTIGAVLIPDRFFFDFLRGYFDGDGCTYSYWDPRWRSSFMFYTAFISASPVYMYWLRKEIERFCGIKGHIVIGGKNKILQLKYAKAESMILIKKMYYNGDVTCLSRKKLKINQILAIVGEKV